MTSRPSSSGSSSHGARAVSAPCPRQAPSQTRSLVLRPPLGPGSPLRWGLELGGLVTSSKVTKGEVAEPSRAQASQAHRLLAFRRLRVCPEAGESPITESRTR